MNKEQQVLEIIAEILEVDASELTLDSPLDETVWDSLAVVTFISEIDSIFDQIISPKKAGTVKTVADLLELVK